jgi:uncharacterized protein
LRAEGHDDNGNPAAPIAAFNDETSPHQGVLSMREIRIECEQTKTNGRYVAHIDGIDGKAELTFTRRDPSLINADHTAAPDSMRGTGAAMALIERMIADARREGFRIVATCPYVQAQYRKHSEWADVMSA